MSPLAAKILIVGIPFLLSVGWFLFWVLRLGKAARRLKSEQAARRERGEP